MTTLCGLSFGVIHGFISILQGETACDIIMPLQQ